MEFWILPPTLRAFLLISSERHSFMAKYQYLKTNSLASWQQTCPDVSHTGKNGFAGLVFKKSEDNWFIFYSFEKNKPRASNLPAAFFRLRAWDKWPKEVTWYQWQDMLSFMCESFICVCMASCLEQHLWSLEVMLNHLTIAKSYLRHAVPVILVVAGVTVNLSVRNCPSFCLSVSLMSGLNGE